MSILLSAIFIFHSQGNLAHWSNKYRELEILTQDSQGLAEYLDEIDEYQGVDDEGDSHDEKKAPHFLCVSDTAVFHDISHESMITAAPTLRQQPPRGAKQKSNSYFDPIYEVNYQGKSIPRSDTGFDTDQEGTQPP